MNPFTPNSTVQPHLFGGRILHIKKILERLSYTKKGISTSFYFTGDRGIGKTSLAKTIRHFSKKQDNNSYDLNFLTSYYSVNQKQRLKNVLENSLNQVTEDMSENTFDRFSKRMGNLFKNGKFEIEAFGVSASYKGDEEKEIEKSAVKDQFVSIIKKIIKEIKREKKYDGILMIIDEIDNLSDIDSAASIIRGITTTLEVDDLNYLSFLFIGYKDGLEKLAKGDLSFTRVIDQIHLEEMPENEVIDTLEKGFKEAEVDWDKKVLRKYASLAGGYPLAIQTMGYNLIDLDTDNCIDIRDWHASAQPSARSLIDKEFHRYYKFFSVNKRRRDEILQVLAISGCPLSSKEIKEITKIKGLSGYLKTLVQDGAIVKNEKNKKYCIRNGFLSGAIRLDFYYSDYKEAEKNISDIRKDIENVLSFRK